MRKYVPVALFSMAIVAITIGILWNSGRAQTVRVNLNVKDAPEQGLYIITASNPSFDKLLALYMKRHPSVSIEAIKPFSAFIENRTEKTVVAYKVKWDCVKADGTVVDNVTAVTILWALTNGAGPNTEATVARDKMVIRPHSSVFVSPLAPTEQIEDTAVNAARPEDDAQIMFALKSLNAELSSYTSITVSIDGAFFNDGGFVGVDTTGYFDEIKAQVDARYDVLRAIQSGIEQGKTGDELFRPAEEAANAPKIKLTSDSKPSDFYAKQKRLMAQEIFNAKKFEGEGKALEKVRMRLGRQWPQLRKL